MQRDDRVYLHHMLDMAGKARALADGKSADDFEMEEVLRLALRHLLQIVGEAAGRVSQQFAGRIPRYPGTRSSECIIVWFTIIWASTRRLSGRPWQRTR
jgi:uncharacterized protein with HEPN domain